MNPVPVRRQFTIEGLEVDAPIVIYNIQGRVVDRLRADAPQIVYNVGNLPSGMYLLRMTSDTGKPRTAWFIK